MRYQTPEDIGRMADRELGSELHEQELNADICECGGEIDRSDPDADRLNLCQLCLDSLDYPK